MRRSINRTKASPYTEAQIQTQIIHWLQFHGWFVMRLNSGAIRTAANHLVRLAEKGTPDLMAFKMVKEPVYPTSYQPERVCLVFIEVKRPGRTATPLQDAKMSELEDHGALCFVATSIEDVEAQLR